MRVMCAQTTSHPGTAPAVQLNGLCFSYGRNTVLQNASLEVESGAYLAMVGPNGGGKTTLVRLLLGILQPQAGTVRLFGQPPSKATAQLGYVPQNTHARLDFPATVLDVVRMGLVRGLRGFGGSGGRGSKDLAHEALHQVGMQHLAGRRISDLSGGQRQRALIARALVSRPKLLVLDEPTASVDPEGRRKVHELLASLTPATTVVAVTHDLSILSAGVTAVACVNRTLHAHSGADLDPDMLQMMYGTPDCAVQPLARPASSELLKPQTKP